MRKFVIAADADGVSRVQSVEPLPPGRRKDTWFWDGTSSDAPELRGLSQLHELDVPPGAARWIMVEFGPHHESIFHRTHTIDLDVVVEGSVDLVLGDGEVALDTGDCVVLLGADHAWRTRDTHCIVSCITLGIEPDVGSLESGGGPLQLFREPERLR